MRRARSRPLPHRSALVCARCPTARVNECASVAADVGCARVQLALRALTHARANAKAHAAAVRTPRPGASQARAQ